MNRKQTDKLILALLVLAFIALNYSTIDSFLERTFSGKHEIFVNRTIDGDTIVSDIGNIRLLGINTPEKGERYYEEAKNFLKSKVENKTIEVEFGKDKYDKYHRILGYIFLDNKNINIEIVENGLANYYFYEGRDTYSDDLEDAWQVCLNNSVNLCEKSKNICTPCINIDKENIINLCNFNCYILNWTIKGEGREKFIFSEKILQPIEKIGFDLDLTNSSGSLFLRDNEGKLVMWGKY